MRVLVVTGSLAREEVKRQTADLVHEVDVLALPVTVAAFITPRFAAQQLKKHSLKDYDMILIPGSVAGDVSPVEEATGVPTFKGPMHAAELPLVLTADVQLSKTVPANLLIQSLTRERAHAEIRKVDRNWRETLEAHGGVILGTGKKRLPVGPGFPMRVVAEIVNAPTLSLDEVRRRAEYYSGSGADMIDIGMMAQTPSPESIPGIIEAVKDASELPLSIDSLHPREIAAAVEHGVDLVLSIDAGNMEKVAPLMGDAAAVVLPTNMSRGVLPVKTEERVEAMHRNMRHAKKLGIKKLVADLVAEPLLKPGLMEALKAYQQYHKEEPTAPLLFGIGNIVELIDADSTGVIASFTALGAEVGANMLHIPEHSVKARGSVREAVEASRMMFTAARRGTLPKDLGVDLLVLKEKQWKEEPYPGTLEEEANVVRGVHEGEFIPDGKGWFKVQIDRGNSLIAAIHYPNGEETPDTVVKGETASEIYLTIIRLGLVSRLGHAAYLGKELEKAETALRLGRSYVQDEPLFRDLSREP